MTSPWNQQPNPDDWQDDDDGFDQNTQQNQQGQNANPVRKRMRELERQNRELAESNAKLQAQVRVKTVSDTLAQKGYSPKLANLIPQDIEPTAEAIDKWLADYADVFAASTSTESSSEGETSEGEGDGSGVADQYGLQMGRIAEATTAAKSGMSNKDEVARELASKDLTRERLVEMIHKAGGGFGIG